jgi:hypothetical protein
VDDYASDDEVANWINRATGFDGDDDPKYDLVCIASGTNDWVPSPRSLQVISLCPLLRLPILIGAMMELEARASTVVKSGSRMFLSNPPCKAAHYMLIWESRVHGVCDAQSFVQGTFECEEGITFVDLINDALGRPGIFHTSQLEHRPWAEAGSKIYLMVDQIDGDTLQEQIATLKSRNTERVVRLKNEDSRIDIWSTIAPTADEYEQMNTLGRVKASVLYPYPS